ncbi:hypothetical protein RvY_00843 [Ramazzottius varieornatus]|uniref:Uncharacterized protein n=1 Tax=Ramazzottius varieornatus TaxID=947166 RepID=A0A1D1UKB8_RAMVA|nr:hypothetical protein RvY_00843 [Ramazzottius varieornatus]
MLPLQRENHPDSSIALLAPKRITKKQLATKMTHPRAAPGHEDDEWEEDRMNCDPVFGNINGPNRGNWFVGGPSIGFFATEATGPGPMAPQAMHAFKAYHEHAAQRELHNNAFQGVLSSDCSPSGRTSATKTTHAVPRVMARRAVGENESARRWLPRLRPSRATTNILPNKIAKMSRRQKVTRIRAD